LSQRTDFGYQIDILGSQNITKNGQNILVFCCNWSRSSCSSLKTDALQCNAITHKKKILKHSFKNARALKKKA